MVNVQIASQFEEFLPSEEIVTTAEAVLNQYAEESGLDLTIVIDTDETIQQLNRDYLGIDSPTDVLSFYAHEFDPDTGTIYLGDVILSYPRAEAQAAKAGHVTRAEVLLLVIHGTLHLLGFDHAAPEQKAAMWAAQQHLLEKIGVDIKQLPEV